MQISQFQNLFPSILASSWYTPSSVLSHFLSYFSLKERRIKEEKRGGCLLIYQFYAMIKDAIKL
jgi:hypothetical protein